ncbi:F-box/kelch-repeat protein At3g06240-like [Chenopodium quinoa]|uniref:F-box/kelch-repeat protein At3g06240-like n=1 Tax=Chenopodium quinoa TaxID=63459 RepID=UPI000B79133F|nr:F-box/kelch-repeat protein At3g06240-like [Chenopodium quinoa]
MSLNKEFKHFIQCLQKKTEQENLKVLPDEIIVEIFSWLPAKSVGRFRCASKPWRSLLTQPQFIESHLTRTKRLPREEESLILVSHDSHCLYSIQFNNSHLFDELTSVLATKLTFDGHHFSSSCLHLASCDGLTIVKDEEEKFLLINPTTREIKVLPSSPYAPNPLTCGLGYDSVNDDYKVVMISHSGTDAQMLVSVYSARNGTWKSVENSPFDHSESKYTSVVSVDGYINWVAFRPSDDMYAIAAFDLEKEIFQEVPLSSLVDDDKSVLDDSEEFSDTDSEEFEFDQLAKLGGCLCAYPSSISDTCHEIFVAMMKEYGVKESWTKIFISDFDAEITPLCLLGKKQMVLVLDEQTTGETLVMYDLEERTVKDIVVHGIPDRFGVGGSFMESLVSPHCSN